MAKYKIAWLPGDGVGVDVLEAAKIVLDALRLDAEYIHGDIGWECWRHEGDASLVLRVTTPTAGGERSVLFMGDVRSPGFALLAERDVDLRADAVFAPEARSGAEKVSRLSGAEVVIWNHTPRGSPTHTDWPNPRQDGCTGVIVSPGGALLTAPWNATAIPDEPRTK